MLFVAFTSRFQSGKGHVLLMFGRYNTHDFSLTISTGVQISEPIAHSQLWRRRVSSEDLNLTASLRLSGYHAEFRRLADFSRISV
jgi:hypothetical protein